MKISMNHKLKKIIPWTKNNPHWSIESGVNKRIQVEGVNNQIIISSSTNLYNLQIIINGNNNKLKIGGNCTISGFIEMFGDNNEISIGKDTLISSDVRLTAHRGKHIKIGERCLIADLTDIRTTDSHSILNDQKERINYDESVEIGDRVWLAREVMVLKGAIIGNDVVIGPRSVVSQKIPPNTVAVGFPARVVRTNTTWLVESI
ncbi:MAG: acyltransferase [Nostocales cyanobacterium]|nr:MAG: acyltransferase [Nostocales cyanobacterium]